MTITREVQQGFFDQRHDQLQLICIPPTKRHPSETSSPSPSPIANRWWTAEEHERFLKAIELFPQGPWKAIAEFVGNKTARQAMTHGQKYRQKIARRKRGLQMSRHRRQTADHKMVKVATDQSPIRNMQQPRGQVQMYDLTPIDYHAITNTTTTLSYPESPTEVSVTGSFDKLTMVPQAFTPAFHSEPRLLASPPQLYQFGLVGRGGRQDDYLKDIDFIPFDSVSLQPPIAFQSTPADSIISDDSVNCFSDLLHPHDNDPQQTIRDMLAFLQEQPTGDLPVSTMQ